MSGVQAYLAGLTFALAASPCSTPVLATLLGYVATSRVCIIGYISCLSSQKFITVVKLQHSGRHCKKNVKLVNHILPCSTFFIYFMLPLASVFRNDEDILSQLQPFSFRTPLLEEACCWHTQRAMLRLFLLQLLLLEHCRYGCCLFLRAPPIRTWFEPWIALKTALD